MRIAREDNPEQLLRDFLFVPQECPRRIYLPCGK